MKFRNYKSCIDYLFSLERRGIKYDLNNIRVLVSALGNPHRKFRSVHIAGTNGKGSAASMLSSVLTESCYKTGLYTSPHISDFRERIRINGRMISEDYVIRFTEKMHALFGKVKPSFFEATTAMAFSYFADNNVDYAVIECGLGGRLDSTNVLRPVLSVITGISMDHTEYLGNTIEKIAYEKAGIIKRGIPCVAGSTAVSPLKIIRSTCLKRNTPFIYAGNLKLNGVKHTKDGIRFSTASGMFRLNKLSLPLSGKFQEHNIRTVMSALGVLQNDAVKITNDSVRKGLLNVRTNTGFGFRFEKIASNPDMILDVSHNHEGIRSLRQNLLNVKYRKLIVIFGMMQDKEYAKCINELEKLNGFIILTRPDYKRAADPDMLFGSIRNRANAVSVKSVKDAYSIASRISGKNDLILVTGSFFLAADFLKLFRRKK